MSPAAALPAEPTTPLEPEREVEPAPVPIVEAAAGPPLGLPAKAAAEPTTKEAVNTATAKRLIIICPVPY